MATLSIVYKGVDEVAAVSKDVAKGIDDVGEAADKAKPAGTGFFSGMLQTASGFLAANVMGAIASQVGAFVSDGLSAARDTQQLMAQTETIIKNTGGAAGISAQEVADLASSLSDAAGKSLFGDDQIQGAENVLLKYKELKGIIPGVTQLSVDMAQSLGKDPAAAAEFLGRALQKPFDAAAKLAKEGIVLTDSQKATLDAFKKTGDTAGAQAFLMEQLNGTYAGSAKAAADAAGGSVQFKARMGEVAENLASAALPLLDKLAGLLNDYVAPAIETVATWLGDTLPGAIDVVVDAISSVVTWFSDTGTGTSALSTHLAELNTWFQDNLPPAIAAVSDFFNTQLLPALNTLWAFIQENVIPIIDTLVNVAFEVLKTDLKILAWVWTNVLWPALQTIWKFIDKNIIPILASLIVWIKDNLPPTIRTLSDLWNNTLLPALTAVWGFIDKNVIPLFKALVETHLKAIKTAVAEAAKVWTETLQPALKTFIDYVTGTVVPAFTTFMSNTLTPIAAAFTTISDAIQAVIRYVGDMISAFNSVHVPSWFGASPPSDDGGGGGGDAPAPSGGGGSSGGGSGGQGLLASRRSPVPAGGASTGQTITIVIDDRNSTWLSKLIDVKIDEKLKSAGASALSRQRTGN